MITREIRLSFPRGSDRFDCHFHEEASPRALRHTWLRNLNGVLHDIAACCLVSELNSAMKTLLKLLTVVGLESGNENVLGVVVESDQSCGLVKVPEDVVRVEEGRGSLNIPRTGIHGVRTPLR